ncbi:MAG: FAD-binding oxidoreductase, partial [Acidobacteria bacterium]|nr:FAD-binding oxidoreductase [Acidobacteriota bacterium]
MSREACELLVVGGGIVGAACALEAVRAGLSVCLCESGVVGGGATAAGMGHLVVMDDSEAQFALTRRSLALWHQLAHYLPEAAEYHRSGTIWVAADELEMEEVWRKRDYFTQSEVRVEVLDSKQLAEAEPRLRPGLVGALLVLDDAVVYSP